MNPSIALDPTPFDLDDVEDVIGLVKNLVNGRHPGILGTVNAEGRPSLRWMSTLAFEEFPVFQTLTNPESRKIQEIEACPFVNWMFFNDDLSLIVNLSGKARIIRDVVELKRVWQTIVDKSHTYFLNQYATKLGFVVIETTVETIECNSPKNALRFSVAPGELSNH